MRDFIELKDRIRTPTSQANISKIYSKYNSPILYFQDSNGIENELFNLTVSKEYTVEVPISKADIVIMYTSPVLLIDGKAGVLTEHVSTVIKYDHDNAVYGDGGNVYIQAESGSAAISTYASKSNSFGASADKNHLVKALVPAAGLALTANKGIVITNGTALFSDPGVAEVSTIQITAAEDAGGICTVTLNGVTYSIPISLDANPDVNASEINAYIVANVTTHSSTVVTDTVTITANAFGNQTNTAFDAGTCNSLAATVVTTIAGVASALGTATAIITYKEHIL